MTVVELPGAPGTGEIYRRVAGGVLRRGRRPDALPSRALVLRDVPVDRDHLARYDRVCGFRLSDALPPTYPHVLAFPVAMHLMTGADFPFPVAGTVHVGNRIEVYRTVDAAERLDLTVRAADLRDHERGRQFDVVADASVAGAPVWRGVSTYLRVTGPSTAKRPERTGVRPASGAVWPVPTRVGGDYAGVSGDRNPIHTSRLGARVFGFPGPIAHGMWSKARCLAALAGRLPEAYAVEVAFKVPVRLPATVAFSATPAWSFALHDARSGRPHLTGSIS